MRNEIIIIIICRKVTLAATSITFTRRPIGLDTINIFIFIFNQMQITVIAACKEINSFS